MSRAFGSLILVALVSASVLGQSAGSAPSFDVADVHVRPYSTTSTPNMTGGVLRGGRYDLRKATMLDLIRTAYGVQADSVIGGPNWLERNRFDVIAKAPESTSPAVIKRMLQTLLAERFKLVVHNDTKPVPGYALTLGSGKPKLKEATGQGTTGCEMKTQTPQPGTVPLAVMACRNVSMEQFMQSLRGFGGAYVSGPVADLTGLKGSWDFDLSWTARALLARAGSDGITLYDAVDKQLGLNLESRSVPAAVLLVDSVNETPTPNPSGVAQNLPTPPPAEFDVADIKLSPPETTTQRGSLQPGGRLDLEGMTMRTLISLAWTLGANDEMLAGGPKWIDETRYSVVAKSSTAIAGSADGLQIDLDDLRLMLRALLVERFKLATHFEDRPVSAYTLVLDKPKLQKADPANRTGCKEGVPPGLKDPRSANPQLSRLVTCQNMSMAQFTEDLPRIAGGYIHNPVVDATALAGSWDFTLNFSPVGLVGNAGGGDPAAAAGSAPTASTPTGALSLFDALTKQLGLRLELRKRPLPVLVIDHVEEKPSDN